MEKKNILVTGGFGYVGSRLTSHLIGLGYPVRVLDLCLYGDSGLKALSAGSFEHVRGDTRDPDVVAAALKGIDTVINLAAISNDPTGEVDEVLTRQVNFDAVGLLVSLARELGVKRVIHASSSSVFGIKEQSDVTEDLEPEPITQYSKTKMLAEWVVKAAASPDLCTVNIRPATICGYSPRQRFDLTVNKLTADAVRKRVITVHGGEQRRPNVGMTDIVNLYARLIEIDARMINGRTFNFGFENLKVIEIAKVIQQELADLDVRIDITETKDNRDYHISSGKILERLGYKTVSSIRQEVRNLRQVLESSEFKDIDAAQYYNMKFMKLGRNASAYNYLAKCE